MKNKILVLLSSAHQVPLREGGHHSTGLFLGELVEPLAPLINRGFEIHFTSPSGKAPHIDPHSYKLMYWNFSRNKLDEGMRQLNYLKSIGLEDPLDLNDLLKDEDKLKQYDLLFVPGGHAPMNDLLHLDWMISDEKNTEVGRLLTHFKKHNKLTALICHAPSILASALDKNGRSIYAGYEATCVTRLSEFLTEDLPPFKTVPGHIKKYPEDFLRESGVKLKQNLIPMVSHVVVDRNLITGQDPFAAANLGQEILKRLIK